MARNAWRESERGSLLIGFALWCADRSRWLLRALGVVLPLLVPTVLHLGCYSEHPEAVRTLRALPIDAPARFHAGAVKALLAGTALPPYAVIGALSLATAATGGSRPLVSAIAAILTSAWLGLTTARRMKLVLPFSLPLRHGQANTASMEVVIALGLATGVILGVHVAVARFAPLLLPFAAAAMALLLLREYRAFDASSAARAQSYDDTLLSEVA